MKSYRIVIGTVFLAIVCSNSHLVMGFPQFNSGFRKLYLNDDTSEEFKTVVKKAKCGLCHDDTKKKEDGTANRKFRNPYGEALDKLLSKDDKKNKEKIRASLEKVAGEKAAGSDETFGERIKNEQLPYVVK